MVNITVKLHKNDQYGRENIDNALRRFKNKLDQEEIMEVVKRKRSFETPKQIKIRKLKRLHKKLKEIKNFSSKKN
jgi:ribosomal protein S21